MKQQSSVMEIQKQPIISEEPSISEKEDLPPCETLENVQIKTPEKEIPQKPEESGSIIKANLILTIFHLGLNGCKSHLRGKHLSELRKKILSTIQVFFCSATTLRVVGHSKGLVIIIL